ncbi:hypothetical protein NC796_17140 [Aliifodinibius sp. S!AR15-10]|uniref:hypothetical protein n=1 Tax=Aliifodinibius sp. S!AR15-10 TaxID=2950437 RepID=UPI00286576FB|nr:hypothetical protein [Aliifodinibius sp. S!AR15-10]MDR8392884.1 hypothetical protein [Aliifodinibius sp. S!AR15-10]
MLLNAGQRPVFGSWKVSDKKQIVTTVYVELTLNNAQIIFATVLTLVLLFAGCSETPNGTATSSRIQPQPQLEGVWVAIDQNGNVGHNNLLYLTESTGFHQISSKVKGTDELYMQFEYERSMATSFVSRWCSTRSKE